jgi:hypothetical protein
VLKKAIARAMLKEITRHTCAHDTQTTTQITLSGADALTSKGSKQLSSQLKKAVQAQPNVTRGSVKVSAPKVAKSRVRSCAAVLLVVC